MNMPLSALNGKTAEVMRYVLGSIFAVIVAYFTAQLAIRERVTAVETAERLHFDEVQRSLMRIESDLRDVKRELSIRK